MKTLDLLPKQTITRKDDMEGRLAKFLIGILYHEPESIALWQKGFVEDCESSTGLFVKAETSDLALAWGEKVGQELLRRANADPTLNFNELGYYCWLEENPSTSQWQHCLDFFQVVGEGEFPDFDEMGTKAYKRWITAARI